jgi:ribose transport system substrate-binding protein
MYFCPNVRFIQNTSHKQAVTKNISAHFHISTSKTSRIMKNVAGLIFTFLTLASCSPDKPASAGSPHLYRLAMIPKGATHVHWLKVHAGAEKAAAEMQNVEILWQAPQKEDDRQGQIQVVQNMVSRQVDAIILAPLDAYALRPPVKAAKNRQIPVVLFDSGLQTTDFQSFVATDNFAGGKLCAKRLTEVLGGKGKVILLKYAEGSDATLQREAGFLAGIKELAPQIQIISGDQYAGATFEKALQVSQNLLNKFASPDGVFCSNETSTMGMLRALQLAGKTGKVKLVGFDMNQTLLKGLQDKVLSGVAVQDPLKMGYESVRTAMAILKKQPFQKRIDTGILMVTPDNLTDPAVQSLIR